MRQTTDGFVIAEKDLELRGPGELLGTRQTGLAGFRIADLIRELAQVVKDGRQDAVDELLDMNAAAPAAGKRP